MDFARFAGENIFLTVGTVSPEYTIGNGIA